MGCVGQTAVLAAVALLCACDAPSQVREPAVYVGVSGDDSDGEVSIALAVAGRFVALYACTDDPTGEEYPGWLTGDAYRGDGRIRLARGAWTFTGSVTAGGAEGTLVGEKGARLRWSGSPARAGTVTGLFTAFDSGCTTGIVVIDDAHRPSPLVRGAWCDDMGRVRQVIVTVSPPRLVDGHLPAEVSLETGNRRLEAAPVTLPLP